MGEHVTEQERLADIATTFSSHEGFNRSVIEYGFRSLQPLLRGRRCLEMGSADGAMTHLLAGAVEQLVSIDGSEAFANAIRDELGPRFPGLEAVHTLFEDYEPDEPFDTIVAAHVFEHVDDPVAIARRALPWVAPGGALIVIVPNAHSFNRLLGVEMGMIATCDELVAGDLAIGHRRVYTPAGLEADLAAAGWRVVLRTGVFFKPVSNAQMLEMFTPEMVAGCWELGRKFPDNAGDILCVCEPA
jgi:2-polyprenyl-3-methyl-5-hydroxy-6-metoxy-1,4-benzoquinol methylase